MKKNLNNFCAALLLAMLSVPASAGDPSLATVEAFRAAMQPRFTGECTKVRAAVHMAGKNNTPALSEQAPAFLDLWCNCVPAEFMRATEGIAEPIAMQTASDIVDKTARVCMGKENRASIIGQCASDPDAIARTSDVAAYCGCVGERIAKLDDEALHSQTTAAYKAMVSAQEANASPTDAPTGYPAFPIYHFGKGCEAARK